jgi:hypothetical protein
MLRQAGNANTIQNALGEIEPTALMGLEALLHLVQASNAVPGPVPHLALAGPSPDRNIMTDHAVHVAAAALSQLSRQSAPGVPSSNGPMAEILYQVRNLNMDSFCVFDSFLSDSSRQYSATPNLRPPWPSRPSVTFP